LRNFFKILLLQAVKLSNKLEKDAKKDAMKESIETVDKYIDGFPPETQKILQKIRKIIQKSAPEAVESLGYGMPAYKLNGKPLVYFAAFKNHIGFYATPNGHAAFSQELSKYKQGKGSVQFPIDQPMPFELIEKIVRFHVGQNLSKAIKNNG